MNARTSKPIKTVIDFQWIERGIEGKEGRKIVVKNLFIDGALHRKFEKGRSSSDGVEWGDKYAETETETEMSRGEQRN